MSSTPPPWALITGAAGGIGEALVKEFSASGYAVIATDRVAKPEALHCTHYVQADLALTVSDPLYADRILVDIKKTIGTSGLSALINNAALQILGGANVLSRDDWQQTISVNLLAPFFLTQALLPDLESVAGCVVNISSIHARHTKKGFTAYATSKAALSGMTRSLAVDFCGTVRVNGIEPAAIDTPMLRAGFAADEGAFRQLQRFHPSGTIGSAEQLARLARYLADPANPFLNGAIVPFDGGIGSVLHDPGNGT